MCAGCCDERVRQTTPLQWDLAFGPIAMTRKMCAADVMAVEDLMAKVLAKSQPYTIAGDSLKIGGNGEDGLTLKGAK